MARAKVVTTEEIITEPPVEEILPPVSAPIEPPVTGVKPEAALKAVRKLTPEDYANRTDEVYARLERIFTQLGIVSDQGAITMLLTEYFHWSTQAAEREALAAKQRKLANMQRRQEKLKAAQEALQTELGV